MTVDLSHIFGTERVTPAERDQRMRHIFERLAPRYERLCDVQTFGLHRRWRRALARAAAETPAQRIVDLAGGTGEMARLIVRPGRLVTVCDPSLAMMNAGRARAPQLTWVAGVGRAMPFADRSVDMVTMAFGLRNVTYVEAALHEVLRVLKPGGRFLCLEVARPWAPVRPFYYLFLRSLVPRLGSWVLRVPEAYAYLIESVRSFPSQEEVKKLIQDAGFTQVSYRNLSLGIACLYIGSKPDNGSV